MRCLKCSRQCWKCNYKSCHICSYLSSDGFCSVHARDIKNPLDSSCNKFQTGNIVKMMRELNK